MNSSLLSLSKTGKAASGRTRSCLVGLSSESGAYRTSLRLMKRHRIDKATNQIEMSFRSESAVGSSKAEFVLDDLAVGQRVHGKVKKIETYGIFITINDTKLSGLCHKSEVSSIS